MAEFSHRSSQGAKASRRRLLGATALVVILIVIDVLSGGGVRNLVRSLGAAIWNSTAHVRTSIVESGYFATHRSLAKDNATLRAQVARLEEQAAGYDVLREENAQLRTALNFSTSESTITAPVVSSFTSSPYGTFLIGAGIDDAISTGDLVVSSGGFVIGVASDVQKRTTSVRGVLSPGERIDALLGETALVVLGDGGGNAHASVPLGVVVAEGDPVISPAHGGRAIGVVGKVDAPPASPDQTVYIRVPLNLASLRYVYIVRR